MRNSNERSRDTHKAARRGVDQTGKAETMENMENKIEKNQMSVIGADIIITGNIEASVDLHIEGRVNGDVRCATLILGESSAVHGSIYADRVRVSGTVEGAIQTGDLAIEASAQVRGDVSYERLRVANGGSIEGQMKRTVVEGNESGKLKLVEPVAVEPKQRAIVIE
jgi:cytoskeletal protein CcmA (bactofilin family)